MAEKAEKVEKTEKAPVGFVLMKRDPEIYSPPYEVAVPVSEVDNYKSGGYEPVK